MGDVTWVRREMHMWIYTNVKEKWSTVRRRGGDRLTALFSGYNTNRWCFATDAHAHFEGLRARAGVASEL